VNFTSYQHWLALTHTCYYIIWSRSSAERHYHATSEWVYNHPSEAASFISFTGRWWCHLAVTHWSWSWLMQLPGYYLD